VDLPPGYRIGFEERPAGRDSDALGVGLDEYNREFLGPTELHRVAIFVRDEAGTVRGGLDGHVYGGWLFVKYLWVRADLRRHGIGRELMAQAERRALEVGAHSVWLDTFSFQAPGFYQKLGYREFGRLDFPPEHQRIFLQKLLSREPPHADAS